jgi:serine O-acetyltransferase
LAGGIWAVKAKCAGTSRSPLRQFWRQLWKLWMRENGNFIEYSTVFLNQPCFPHGIRGIFISGDAQIGRNCVIFQQVTIGSNYLPKSKRMGAPRIGDNCFIGAGAKIIGGITIGSGSRIGAGCVVCEDVPENSVVVLNAPRVIRRESPPRNHYYGRRKDGWYYYMDEQWHKEVDNEIIASLETARCGHPEPSPTPATTPRP